MNNQQPCKTYSRTELSFWCLMEWIVICIILLFLSVYYAMIVFLIIILWTSQGKFSVTRGLCITNFFPSPESVILSEFFYWKSLSHSLFHCGRHYLCTSLVVIYDWPNHRNCTLLRLAWDCFHRKYMPIIFSPICPITFPHHSNSLQQELMVSGQWATSHASPITYFTARNSRADVRKLPACRG